MVFLPLSKIELESSFLEAIVGHLLPSHKWWNCGQLHHLLSPWHDLSRQQIWNPINHGSKHTIIADNIQTSKYSSICLPRVKPTTRLVVFYFINLRILWCSSVCWKQEWYIFNVYYMTLPTTDTQHFFAEYLFSFENKVWQFQIKFFNNFKLLRIRYAKYTPCIAMYFVILTWWSLIFNDFNTYQ